MRLEWIEDILAVLECGSLARAAEQRFITQSAFTRRMRMIEDSIGAALLDRTRKPVVLLPEIAALEPDLRELASRLNRLRNALHTASDREGRSVSIAFQHALTMSLSLDVTDIVSADISNVRIQSGDRDECLMLLLSGAVDLAFNYDMPGENENPATQAFDSIVVRRDALLPVCAPALHDTLSHHELPAVTYPPGSFLGRVFDRAISPRMPKGVIVQSTAEASLTLAMLQFALHGHGVAWLPQSMVSAHVTSGHLVDLQGEWPTQDLQIRMYRRTAGTSRKLNLLWVQLSEALCPDSSSAGVSAMSRR